MVEQQKKIEFNSGYFSLVNELTSIEPSMVFIKEAEHVVVKRAPESRYCGFKVVVPVSFFDFDGVELAISDFKNFYNSLYAFESPSINQKGNEMVIESAKGRINYKISQPRAMLPSPNNINDLGDASDISFNVSSSDLGDMLVGNAVVKAQAINIKYTANSSHVAIKLTSKDYSNSFDKTFTVSKPSTFDIDFNTRIEMITKVPNKENYVVNIDKRGAIAMVANRDGIYLVIGSGRISENAGVK